MSSVPPAAFASVAPKKAIAATHLRLCLRMKLSLTTRLRVIA
jgi:hypothetical protein